MPVTARASPADLKVANRPIVTLRATNEFGATPEVRARGIHEGLQALIDHQGPLAVSAAAMPGGIAIIVDGHPLFRVLPGDADPETGETVQAVADASVSNLKTALKEVRESRDSRAMATAAGKALLLTLVYALVLAALLRVQRIAVAKVRDVVVRRSNQFTPAWSRYVMGPTGYAELATVPVRVAFWGFILLVTYQWAALLLRLFPYTRPWGERLLANLLDALGQFGQNALEAIPGLLFVALIFVIARFIGRLARAFFEGVHTGRLQVSWLDDTIARPTGRLMTAVIWLFALVAAYPYLPGSGSEAFKGIGVFVGLMLSIGASGIVSQGVSGLMLMYTRTLRIGEFVQVGDVEGTVTSVGFVNTRIETLRNVEVVIPNAYIAGNVTRNFSRLAGNGGVRIATSVTIGYDTPWRQVQAMLQIAASRTGGVAHEPAPRVLQTALKDFYVEYTLVVCAADPRARLIVLNELHGHVQDVFNEHGVQIMSPNYEADPGDKKIVPRENWYASPASATSPSASAAETVP
jgi:small-conductance mechanosensitive channel